MSRWTEGQTDKWTDRLMSWENNKLTDGLTDELWAEERTDGRTDRWTDSWCIDALTEWLMDGRTDERTDGRTVRHIDRQTDGRCIFNFLLYLFEDKMFCDGFFLWQVCLVTCTVLRLYSTIMWHVPFKNVNFNDVLLCHTFVVWRTVKYIVAPIKISTHGLFRHFWSHCPFTLKQEAVKTFFMADITVLFLDYISQPRIVIKSARCY
jgi:hypothetical protein